MVEFCPNCEKLLRKKKFEDGVFLACADCDYRKEIVKRVRGKKGLTDKKLEKKLAKHKTRVNEGDDLELLPTQELPDGCEKCENKTVYYAEFQTRSADEPATIFYTCKKCGHKWREY